MHTSVRNMARTPLSLPFSGAKLRGLRERRGLLQKDLSAKMAESGQRLGRPMISQYESGAAVPSPPTFLALVRVLDCDPDDLLDDVEAGAA